MRKSTPIGGRKAKPRVSGPQGTAMRALSIRQPFAEQILRGEKRIEFRSIRTSILNERVYIYASIRPKNALGQDLPRGVIVGTVEIVSCTRGRRWFEWHLRRPKRLTRRRQPKGKPQPVWFYPFPRSGRNKKARTQ